MPPDWSYLQYIYIIFAGTTAQALVEGVASVTRGAIKGRFFHFYPQRDVEILKWLGHWMKKGNTENEFDQYLTAT